MDGLEDLAPAAGEPGEGGYDRVVAGLEHGLDVADQVERMERAAAKLGRLSRRFRPLAEKTLGKLRAWADSGAMAQTSALSAAHEDLQEIERRARDMVRAAGELAEVFQDVQAHLEEGA